MLIRMEKMTAIGSTRSVKYKMVQLFTKFDGYSFSWFRRALANPELFVVLQSSC